MTGFLLVSHSYECVSIATHRGRAFVRGETTQILQDESSVLRIAPLLVAFQTLGSPHFGPQFLGKETIQFFVLSARAADRISSRDRSFDNRNDHATRRSQKALFDGCGGAIRDQHDWFRWIFPVPFRLY